MTARVIGRSLCLLAEIFGGAAIDRCRVRRGQMIAPRIGNSKCFDESDHVRIERAQGGCLRTAPFAVAIFPSFYMLHAAPIMPGVWSVEGHSGSGRPNGCVLAQIGWPATTPILLCASLRAASRRLAPGAAQPLFLAAL